MLRTFDAELEEFEESLLTMGRLAETMMQQSVEALVTRDDDLARGVLRYEEEMDQRCLDLDDRSFKLLALGQPVASDLRLIGSGVKINSDLERIGDLAANIARRALLLLQKASFDLLVDIPKMAELAQGMVKRSLDAFMHRDPNLARSVIETDVTLDSLRDHFLQELMEFMSRNPQSVPQAMNLILVSRSLERIGDHATNIAEDVIYIVRGEDIRHPSEPGTSTGAPAARVT